MSSGSDRKPRLTQREAYLRWFNFRIINRIAARAVKKHR